MIEIAAFWALLGAIVLSGRGRRTLGDKTIGDWLLDLSGLAVQGALIPVLQIVVVAAALRSLAPGLEGRLTLPGGDLGDLFVGFTASFVAVDYLYYWNHRLLHHQKLWPAHMVHHTVSRMDLFGTSRNTLWTSLLFVYLWLNGTMIFLLAEPAGYVAGVTATVVLDMWRHTELDLPRRSRLARLLGAFLILPGDHHWHHADGARPANYGANLNLWDRLHGTFYRPGRAPQKLGADIDLSLARKLLWPAS